MTVKLESRMETCPWAQKKFVIVLRTLSILLPLDFIGIRNVSETSHCREELKQKIVDKQNMSRLNFSEGSNIFVFVLRTSHRTAPARFDRNTYAHETSTIRTFAITKFQENANEN